MNNDFQLSKEYVDYLSKYGDALPTERILFERKFREEKKHSDQLSSLKASLETLPIIEANSFTFNESSVKVGTQDEISDADKKLIDNALKEFIPWKKGPWNLFGTEIDSEWRSDLKWERIKEYMNPLDGKKVADIGCNNGYFMFRMLEQNPELVIGFEPFAKHYFAYNIFQNYVKSPKLHFELLGVENFDLYPKFFDAVFCLGILYHHTDPIGLLRKLYDSLSKGGEIYIDCQGIPGDEPIALMPKNRYTSARGFWWLPTKACLTHWLSRTQFRDIEFFFEEPLSFDEQRSTEWSPHDSLEQFLDPNDKSKTVEGYPAPWRYYVRARK